MGTRIGARAASGRFLGLLIYVSDIPASWLKPPGSNRSSRHRRPGQRGQAGPAAQEPGRGGRGGRGGAGGPGRDRPRQRGRRLHEAPPVLPVPPPNSRSTSSCSPAIASSSCCPIRSSRSRRHRLRRQRPDVRARGSRLHAGRRRHRRARSDRPHLAARGLEQRRRLRQAHRVRRQARVPALRDAVRPQQRPDEGDRTRTRCGSTPTRTATAWRTRRSCSTPASAAPATSSTSRPSCSGRWTTGCTAPSTRSARAGRRTASSRSRPASNGAQWGVTQDNDGKMWFQGGASGVPAYFQFPIVYGNFSGARSVRAGSSGSRGARRFASPTCRAGMRVGAHAGRHR